MRILLDHCVPRRLRKLFSTHEVKTTREMGWESLKNGSLLTQAEAQFDVMITVDKNIRYQQNLTGRPIAIIIMEAASNSPADLIPVVPEVEKMLQNVQPGIFYNISASQENDDNN